MLSPIMPGVSPVIRWMILPPTSSAGPSTAYKSSTVARRFRISVMTGPPAGFIEPFHGAYGPLSIILSPVKQERRRVHQRPHQVLRPLVLLRGSRERLDSVGGFLGRRKPA